MAEKNIKKKAKANTQVDTIRSPAVEAKDNISRKTVTPAEHAAHVSGDQTVHASFADFPHIHPLIVHFPIMLLLIAAVMQFLNVLFLKKELNWAVTIMVLVGK